MAATPLLGPGGQAGTRRKQRLGFPLSPRIKAPFRPRRRGVFSPPHPRRNQGDTPFFKELLVVEAFEEGLKRRTASVRVRRQMVDIPVYNRAKALLEQKQAIDELEQRKNRVVGRLG